MIEIDQDLENFLKKKYNILLHTNTLDFDFNYQILVDNLKKIKKEIFLPNDRIIIEFFDLEFYDKKFFKTGIVIKNIIEIFVDLDIDPCFLIFITNNFNLDIEVEYILSCKNKINRPMVIKTIFSYSHYNKEYSKDEKIDESLITKAAISMNNVERPHRTAIFNFIKNNKLFNKIAITYWNRK